jgi:hypothetical protein
MLLLLAEDLGITETDPRPGRKFFLSAAGIPVACPLLVGVLRAVIEKGEEKVITRGNRTTAICTGRIVSDNAIIGCTRLSSSGSYATSSPVGMCKSSSQRIELWLVPAAKAATFPLRLVTSVCHLCGQQSVLEGLEELFFHEANERSSFVLLQAGKSLRELGFKLLDVSHRFAVNGAYNREVDLLSRTGGETSQIPSRCKVDRAGGAHDP